MVDPQDEGWQEVAGSRHRSWFERWQQSRTLCVPQLCMYEYACPVKAMRQAYVRSRDCYRKRPEDERPPPALSPFARRFIAGLHDGALPAAGGD